MSKFKQIIINRNQGKYLNTEYIGEVVGLFTTFSKYLYDDYFDSNGEILNKIIELIERTSPYFWAVIDDCGEVAGFVFLENITGNFSKFHSAEVTTCFKPKFWGDYTKKCAKKFVKYCFKKYKLKKLKATIFVQNFKVKAILKQTGFKKEATLKAETFKNGKPQDVEIYSIIKKTR